MSTPPASRLPSLHRPLLLIILDGWGYTETTEYNAIHSARKPNWDRLWSTAPHMLLNASGLEVGLPPTQMGNSEVGHMHLGAGRVVDQEFTRITRAIEDGGFAANPVLLSVCRRAVENDSVLHLIGLLSPGGVHGHEDFLLECMALAAREGVRKIRLHAFLDGRDTPPRSAAESLHRALARMRALGVGEFGSFVGRYYAMDRNQRWERTRTTYELICNGRCEHLYGDPLIALDHAYERGARDEFVSPTLIQPGDAPVARMEDGDVLVFANYRADRMRQLAAAFSEENFQGFARPRHPRLGAVATMTHYGRRLNLPAAFPPEHLENTFGAYIADLGLRQLRIAETEKYAHVTFFFNGGKEAVLPGEDRILVPSPRVSTYDQRPEMSADEITGHLEQALRARKYDAIICNYANADMVGHSGDLSATVQAVQVLDRCLGRLRRAAHKAGGELLITADHGNAEQLRGYLTEKLRAQAHTAHTCNPVPLIYVGRKAVFNGGVGTLADVAPTMLHLMGLPIPRQMTGKPLLKLSSAGGQLSSAGGHAR